MSGYILVNEDVRTGEAWPVSGVEPTLEDVREELAALLEDNHRESDFMSTLFGVALPEGIMQEFYYAGTLAPSMRPGWSVEIAEVRTWLFEANDDYEAIIAEQRDAGEGDDNGDE